MRANSNDRSPKESYRQKKIKEIGSASRTRTCDQKINSLLLYQLSYRGTQDGREL